MGERLALFPLGTVLYPGLLLPLQIFEDRFRIRSLDHSLPYLQGEVELLAEDTGEESAAAVAAGAVLAAFRAYLDALAARGVSQRVSPDLPDEPVLLSYVVAAAMVIDLAPAG